MHSSYHSAIGNHVDAYSSPFRSFWSMWGGLTIQGVPWDEVDRAAPFFGPLLHFLFIFAGVILLLNLLIGKFSFRMM